VVVTALAFVCVAATCAPGITAPEGFVTVPEIWGVCDGLATTKGTERGVYGQ
jgi:hypothetical protein